MGDHDDDLVLSCLQRHATSVASPFLLCAPHDFAGTCCDLNNLVTADTVKVGDKVYVMGASGQLVATQVAAVREVYGQGLYNVHTLNGNIIVNGVAASHFTDQTTWDEASRAQAPYWYKLVDMASAIVGAENAKKDALRH